MIVFEITHFIEKETISYNTILWEHGVVMRKIHVSTLPLPRAPELGYLHKSSSTMMKITITRLLEGYLRRKNYLRMTILYQEIAAPPFDRNCRHNPSKNANLSQKNSTIRILVQHMLIAIWTQMILLITLYQKIVTKYSGSHSMELQSEFPFLIAIERQGFRAAFRASVPSICRLRRLVAFVAIKKTSSGVSSHLVPLLCGTFPPITALNDRPFISGRLVVMNAFTSDTICLFICSFLHDRWLSI